LLFALCGIFLSFFLNPSVLEDGEKQIKKLEKKIYNKAEIKRGGEK